MGMVGSPKGLLNFTTLGDDVNVAARIVSAAGPGELLASLELCRSANVETHALEHRELSLKGKQTPMEVAVIPLN
jgi:class 3 adenylate cyclase